MPLGKRDGDDNESNFIGVETEYDFQISCVVDSNIVNGDFDFVVAPLTRPDYRPSSFYVYHFGTFEEAEPFIESDMSMEASLWNSHVVGKISPWIDLDSEDHTLRLDSEIVLKKEIDWATYLCLRACLLPAPKGTSCTNYARYVNQILHSLQKRSSMQLWLRIPFGKSDEYDDDSLVDSWKTWNSFRLLCEHHSHLWVALDNLGIQPSDNSLLRWYGEPVAAFIMHTDTFLSNQIDNREKLVTEFLNRSVQIIISTELVRTNATGENYFPFYSAADSQSHPLRSYREYIALIYQRLDLERGLFESIRDLLQKPPQDHTMRRTIGVAEEQGGLYFLQHKGNNRSTKQKA